MRQDHRRIHQAAMVRDEDVSALRIDLFQSLTRILTPLTASSMRDQTRESGAAPFPANRTGDTAAKRSP